MSGDRAFLLFVCGLMLLVVSLRLIERIPEPTSWWPTLLYIAALMLLLVGQIWFLGAVAEDPGFEWAKLLMFAIMVLLPLGVATRVAWPTDYDLVRWSAAVLLVLETVVFFLTLFDWPSRGAGPPKSGDSDSTGYSRRRPIPG